MVERCGLDFGPVTNTAEQPSLERVTLDEIHYPLLGPFDRAVSGRDVHARADAEAPRDAVTRAGLIRDAHLAALAMEYGLILCSSDADFDWFT